MTPEPSPSSLRERGWSILRQLVAEKLPEHRVVTEWIQTVDLDGDGGSIFSEQFHRPVDHQYRAARRPDRPGPPGPERRDGPEHLRADRRGRADLRHESRRPACGPIQSPAPARRSRPISAVPTSSRPAAGARRSTSPRRRSRARARTASPARSSAGAI